MGESSRINPIDLRVGFIIAFGGVLSIYIPLICSIVGNILEIGGFWDRMKQVPYVFQMFLLVCMFVGVGVIAHHFMDLMQYMMDFLFGKDEEPVPAKAE